MKQTKTKKGIHVNWVGVFLTIMLALIAYCASWIYVLNEEEKRIERQLYEIRMKEQAMELVGKNYFEIEENEINDN